MSQITPTSAAWRARAGLLEAVRVALADEQVDIESGWSGPSAHPDWVAMGDVKVDADPKTIGPRRSWDEQITLDINVGSWASGHGDAAVDAAYARADHLLSLISTHVTTGDNTTLGDVVAWCFPGSADWAGAEYDGGFQVEIAATFVCSHRVRAA